MPNPLTNYIADKIFTVTEYLTLVNELLSPLKVSVEGEISDLKILPQWVFFSLKDTEDGSLLRCGLHAGVFRRMGVQVEEGMKVKVVGYGKISPNTGNFGFWVSSIEPLGEGALKRAYELLLKKLESEGLFARKREIPMCIEHIGVISSKNGVVLQDLMKNLSPRGIRIDFIHSGVEGASSSSELLQAIEFFNSRKEKPDVLILIRGGGSLESLQGFNNEAVVRALFASPIPTIVGIGHDVDAPIVTFVADRSASTPTAVAHVINDSWKPLTEGAPLIVSSITYKFEKRMQEVERRVENGFYRMKLPLERLFEKAKKFERYFDEVVRRVPFLLEKTINRASRSEKVFLERMNRRVHEVQTRVASYEKIIILSNPETMLKKGFSLVYTKGNVLVRSVENVREGDELAVRLRDGTLFTKVNNKE